MARMETPRIEVPQIVPRATEDEKVVADLSAALYFKGDGDPDGGIRVLDITFQAKSAVTTATGISLQNGFFEQKNLILDECPEDKRGLDVTEVLITATYNEGDEVRTVTESVILNISKQLDDIYGKKADRKKAEEKRLQEEKDKEVAILAQKERERLKKEAYEALVPERKRQIKADITKAGEDIKSTQRFQMDPFNVLREHADHPHAEITALMVAEDAPERTIEGVEIYKSAKWAGKVIKIAAEKMPLNAIRVIEKYSEMGWAQEVLETASKKHPREAVHALPRYCLSTWCEDLIMHIAEISPQAVLEEVEMWEYYPWAEKVAMMAARKAPNFTMNNYRLYQNQKWADSVYRMVAVSDKFIDAETVERQRLLKESISEAGANVLAGKGEDAVHFTKLYMHRAHPHSKTTMFKIVGKKPSVCIKYIEIYKSAEWAGGIILNAVDKDPELAIKKLNDYVEMPWAGEVMKKATELKPVEAIQSLPIYAKYQWAKPIIESIAQAHPDKIFEQMKFIEFQPWAKDIVKKASVSRPEMALQLYEGYKDQPWSEAVVKKTAILLYETIVDAIDDNISGVRTLPQHGITTRWKECDFVHKDSHAIAQLNALMGNIREEERPPLARLLAPVSSRRQKQDMAKKVLVLANQRAVEEQRVEAARKEKLRLEEVVRVEAEKKMLEEEQRAEQSRKEKLRLEEVARVEAAKKILKEKQGVEAARKEKLRLEEVARVEAEEEATKRRAIERSRRDTRRVLMVVGVLVAIGGAIAYKQEISDIVRGQKNEEKDKDQIITFDSEEEGVRKGLIIIRDGKKYPKEGYEWAYPKEESDEFIKGDVRRFAVKESEVITFDFEEGVEKGFLIIKDEFVYPKEGYEWAYPSKERNEFPKGDPRVYAVKKSKK